jgi:signal transduction histidine kinase
VDLCVYRVVQEALTNSLRHAGPSPTTAVVRYEQNAIQVSVTDTGPGPVVSPSPGGGHGLVGMRERVLLYGGTVSAEPAADGGFVVRARIPVSA